MPDRLYRLFLFLCPADFRDEYGGEMARLFRDRCRREGILRVALEAAPDLLIGAGREHMDTLWRDIKYAFRTLGKSAGFTAVAFLSLMLGIGANTAMFSVVSGVLLEPLPYRHPERLVRVYEKRPRQGRLRNPVTVPDFLDWRKLNTVFEGMVAMSGDAFTLPGENGPQRIRACAVSADFFRMLGVTPLLGRDFLPEEETPGHDQVLMLTYELWQRRFGGDPSIVGRKIALSDKPFTVVGVLGENSNVIRSQADIWIPFVSASESSRAAHYLQVYARTKPGITLSQARAEMDTISSRLEKEYPNENTGHGSNVFSLHDEIVGDVQRPLLVLLGSVALVLLVACANVANLALARATSRRREISIRTVLGAGAGRLIRQLLTESILLSLLAGAAGVLLAWWGVNSLVTANFGNLPRLSNIQVDRPVLAFTLAISVLTGIFAGLAPALSAARTKLGETLKEGGRGTTDHLARGKARGALVMAEVALALMLSIGAGLMMQSFYRLASVNPGFDARNVLTVDLALLGPKYAKPQHAVTFFDEFLRRIEALPGVQSAGATTALPLTGSDSGYNFVIEGRPPLPYSQQPNARYRCVRPGYFETMKIPLRAGRLIGRQDTGRTLPVLVINETMARQYWPDGNALGKRVTLSGEKIVREIAGIVGDVKHYALDGETRPEMYYPYVQMPQSALSIVIRTASAPEGLGGAVRHELAEMDKDVPISAMRTMEDVLSRSMAQARLYFILLVAFSAVGLSLAAVGIFGVMSFAVAQRTHEMGVRMALGARPIDVQAMVLRQGLTLTLGGVGLGLVGAFALTRVLARLLYGIGATDPATFLGAALLLSGVAAAASYLPARRATRVDPIIALRCE